MKKKITKPVGDQLFIKTDVTSLWESARLSDLRALLSDRENPYSSKEKLKLPQFGFGRKSGDTSNQQIYPTKIIVTELDTPPKFKKAIDRPEVYEKWKLFFSSLYEKVVSDDTFPYWYIYLTPSMCGLRSIVKLDKPVYNEKEYKESVEAYLSLFKRFNVDESFFDIKIKTGWFLPPFENYFKRGNQIFRFKEVNAGLKLKHQVQKAISLTEETNSFEEGNRNNYIFHLSLNSNRLGIEKQDLLDYIINSDLNYDLKEIELTLNSGYKNKEEFGVWKDRADIKPAVVSLNALIKRSKIHDPIPVIWSGIKKGALGFIFGPPKSGKTTLAECLGLSLAGGLTEFMGSPLPGEKHRVLYISLEEYWQVRVERNEMQRQYLFTQFKRKGGNRFFASNENFPSYIIDESDLRFVEVEINRCEPDVVIIDSFTRMLMEKVEDSTRVNRMMIKLRNMSKDTGTTILLIHHTTKAKDKSLSFLNMAGSRVLSQEADFLIGVNRTDNGQRYVKDVLFRHTKEREEVVPFEINEARWVTPGDLCYESELIIKKDGRKDDTNKQAIFDFIYSSDEAVTASQIKEHFNNTISKKTIFNNLNKLLEEGKIEKVEKGLYKCSVDKKE
jgi:archaellum biogenesis ATPase FlaH